MSKSSIGLALSGGGVRAMAFHAGVLKFLAESQYLEKTSQISSVSGGSLLVGLIYRENQYQWPSSEQYGQIFLRIRAHLCEKNLQKRAIKNLLKPKNWKYLLSRANVMAETIEQLWGIDARLSDVGNSPLWSINGTTAQTGRRFRFQHDSFGDYELGYGDSQAIKLAQAMASSAAYPAGIGPLAIDTGHYRWTRLNTWGDPSSAETVTPPYKKLNIYDGGIYDNLGTEPLFDSGAGQPKQADMAVLVSDAGRPMPRGFNYGPLDPHRIRRILDITMDQSRALRVRSLMHYLTNGGSGGFLMSSQPLTEFMRPQDLAGNQWMSAEAAQQAANYDTNLGKMREADFDSISQHGYEMARAVHIRRGTFL